jgi:ADP-heptose:LPS heptosyltransferase
MESLKTDYTEVWVASPNVPLIRFADRVRSIASTGLDLVGIPGCGLPDFSAFDSIVSWYGYAREDFRAAVAGFPFQFLPALPPKQSRLHAADFFLQQVGKSCHPGIPRIQCHRAAGDYVVIHPFSGSPKKNWPLERYRELARRLNCRERTDSVPDPKLLSFGGIPGVDRAVCPLLWCAGPEEELDDAVRFDNLCDLACWLAGARLYIGNDSGITHLAAAAGAPVVALFGPTDPAIWGPRGDRVSIVATPTPGEAMEIIPLEAVSAAARDRLKVSGY